MRHRIAILLEEPFCFAIGTHQVKPNARVRFFADKRIGHHHATRKRKRINSRTRREYNLERLCKRIPVQVLDAPRECDCVSRPGIEFSFRIHFERLAVNLVLQPFFYRGRNGNGSSRNRSVNPFVKFQFHIKFIRMVCRLWRRRHSCDTRRELILRTARRSHLRCASGHHQARRQEICNLRKTHSHLIKSMILPMRV